MKKIRKYFRRHRWWLKGEWQQFHQDLLLVLARQRYRLVISEDALLGSCCFSTKTVEINPVGIVFPRQASQRQIIRHAPKNRHQWQQAIAIGLIQHEAAHIRFSDAKPNEPILGWLWNALEDERIERLLISYYPQLRKSRELLNDAAWFYTESSSDLLVGCLLWRWEWHRHERDYKFCPGNQAKSEFWLTEIRPLVEQAWAAPNSDEVIIIAQEIIDKLGYANQAKLPSNLPFTFWSGPKGKKPHNNSSSNTKIEQLPLSPITLPSYSPISIPEDERSDNSIVSSTDELEEDLNRSHSSEALPSSSLPLNINSNGYRLQEACPDHILERVEGYARDLAIALKPPIPQTFRRPHSSRGELNLERALAGHQRPFDSKGSVAPARSVAILTLVDCSGSMKGAFLQEAIAASLLLDRAAEMAGVVFGVWGFTNTNEPIIHRPLAWGHNASGQRSIAGMRASGWTYLTPLFERAIKTLRQRPEQVKLLILFHDGLLSLEDAANVKHESKQLQNKGIFLQPIFIGDNSEAVESNREIFGRILACPDITQLTPMIRSWLRALF